MCRLALALPLLSLLACATPALNRIAESGGGECAFRVCIAALRTPRSVAYVAHNRAAVPATVSIRFQALGNLRTIDPLPVTLIVNPGERVTLTRLAVVRAGRRVSARPVVTVDLGSDATQPDPFGAYRIPFGGTEPHQLSSGYGGPTHLAENYYALDFGMPEGTPVLAARGGVVVYVQDGFSRGGLDPDLIQQANLVAVGHADGTIASYGHLRLGVAVAVGDSVRTGQLLGWSGSTGFSGTPHLHFHVGKRLMGGVSRTIPIQFVVRGTGPVALQEGAWYEPGLEWHPM